MKKKVILKWDFKQENEIIQEFTFEIYSSISQKRNPAIRFFIFKNVVFIQKRIKEVGNLNQV